MDVSEVGLSITDVLHRGLPEVTVAGVRRFDEMKMAVDWVQGLVRGAWNDPVCGDGVCEMPYEHPAYGRFGCQADCGKSERAKDALL